MTMTPGRWQEVKGLFDRALDQPAVSRERWVAEATIGDPAMGHEVRSLLAALEQERDRFERTPGLTDSGPAVTTRPGPTVGARVGPYRLVRQVGQGGMGVVFEAHRDDDQYRKRVAIKMISPGRDGEQILRRFRHERQILARLDHRNIALLLDGGATDQGQPYFAMEFVEGRPIDQYAEAGQLSIRERLQLFRQACSAVHYAHQNLVIHRDLKPGNILVTADGTVKLLDFGIAKLTQPGSESSDEGLTQPGVVPLTTAYASPEQIRGDAVTTASDVFSLGVVLYRLLTGGHPFQYGEATATEVRQRIAEDTPAPPSTRARLDHDLDSIVLTALRKEPGRRYGSVEQLGEDIHRWLSGLPVAAQPDTFGYRVGKFVRRNRAGVVGAALALVALVAGLAATAWQATVAGRERDRARVEAARANQVAQFMQDIFRSADPRVSGKDVTVAEALAAAAERARTDLAGDPAVQAGVFAAIGRTWLGLGNYQQAQPLLEGALALERRLDDSRGAGVTQALQNLAALEADRGELDRAEPLFREALDRARRPPLDSIRLAGILNGFGSLLADKGEFQNAEPVHREALAIRRSVLGPAHEDIATSLNNLAVAIGQQGRIAEAVPLHREALEVIRKVKGAENPDVAAGLNVLANAATIAGSLAEADTLFAQALAMRVRLLGAHHPEVAWTRYSWADMLREKGDFPRAIEQARAVLAERGGSLPESHPMVHSALYVLGRSLLGSGDAAAALVPLREAARLRAAAYPAGHWLTASAEGAVGECLLALHREAEARRILVPALAILEKARGPNNSRVLELRAAIARLSEENGRRLP